MPELKKLPKLNDKQPRWLIALVKEIDGKAAINEEQRRVTAVISSDRLDRDREIITIGAIAGSISLFSKNPVALACHQHRLDSGSSPVVGKWDTDSYKQLAHTSEMDIVFAETELAEEYWQLYKGGFMRAFSIGFCPLEWHQDKDKKNGQHYVIEKIELYEISCVPVGSNRESLSRIKELGIDTDFYNNLNSSQPGEDSKSEVSGSEPSLEIKSLTEKITTLDEKLQTLSDETYDSLEEIKDLLITGKRASEPDESGESDKDESQSSRSADGKQLGQIAETLKSINEIH